MCDKCLERAMEVDQKLVDLMKVIEPEYHALQAKIGTKIRELMKVEIVDEDDQEAEVRDEHKAQFEAEQVKLFNIIGMSAALGWFTALECDDQHDTQMHAHAMFQMIQSKLNEGDAYRYLFKIRRH